jgi:hypothetical protein
MSLTSRFVEWFLDTFGERTDLEPELQLIYERKKPSDEPQKTERSARHVQSGKAGHTPFVGSTRR